MQRFSPIYVRGLLLLLFLPVGGIAQNPDAPPSLKTVQVPEPSNLAEFVKNKDAAIRLGKALFWDMQAGSDGIQACGSCHFHAGADNRVKNQLTPGLLHGSTSFEVGRPNHTLTAKDFPFHRLADPEDRKSAILFDSDDVASSQGVFNTRFKSIIPFSAEELFTVVADPDGFQVDGINVRRVEPRNTPTVINAVFNLRNFWDGRANFIFNGVSPFGRNDPNAFILQVQPDRHLGKIKIEIDNASLASQAVGPPLSKFEMSANGRTFLRLGQKLLRLRPLGKQLVHPKDSVLGPLSQYPFRGLKTYYAAMIAEAFQDKYWNSARIVDSNLDEVSFRDRFRFTEKFTMMEANFSLFWGLAIQLYEATLVSDDSPYDRFQEGNATALTAQQKDGLAIFLNEGKCISCHEGAEFTAASTSNLLPDPDEAGNETEVEGVLDRNTREDLYDEGFFNTGVRSTAEDLGVGEADAFGLPLSFARLAQRFGEAALPGPTGLDSPVDPNEKTAVDGAFKTPTLRNVELTGPYFHNGGLATLQQVVQFYARQGDFHEQNNATLDPHIEEIVDLKGHPERQAALVAFMLALTDDRVRYQRAPFDHPQLFVPNGHVGNENFVIDLSTGVALTELVEIPAVGAAGGPPLSTFLNLPPGDSSNPEPQLVAEKKPAEVEEAPEVTTYELAQNYPNPFSARGTFGNPSTAIGFTLPEGGDVTLAIYDLGGRLVRTLISEPMIAGRHEITWDGTASDHTRVASGVYLYRIQANGFSAQKKLVVAK